jgi:enoyl-CoA hydratase/carnithine racemase
MARDIAANVAPLSAAVTKQLLWEASSLTPEEVGRRETDLHHLLMAHPDAKEGPVAFLERRPPEWQGRVSEDLPDP